MQFICRLLQNNLVRKLKGKKKEERERERERPIERERERASKEKETDDFLFDPRDKLVAEI